jgi:hypothetical protein
MAGKVNGKESVTDNFLRMLLRLFFRLLLMIYLTLLLRMYTVKKILITRQ